jgi:hypothetical protein
LENIRSRGPQPTLADSEVITIEVVGEFLGLDADRGLYRHFRRHHADAFPALARVCRTTFVRQAANLWRVKRTLQRHLAERPAGGATWLIDSLPVHVCRFARATYAKAFAGQAAYGKDHLLRQTFDGFRLHRGGSPDGVILDYDLAPANVSDVAMARGFDPPAGSTGIGDRNYWSPDLFGESAAAGVTLHAPYKNKSRDPDPARSAKPRAARWTIETVFGRLAERFGIKRVRARDLWHLCHRVIRKVLGHTVAVWIGVIEGHRPLRFAQLLND